jgi:hypothetical protein
MKLHHEGTSNLKLMFMSLRSVMVWMDPVILVGDTGRFYVIEHCCTK